jgi:ketosteroid isomerase-like protein
MALVTPRAVTVRSTVPAASAGETAVIELAEFTAKLVALVEPNLTAVAPLKLVPVMVTVVPPPAEDENAAIMRRAYAAFNSADINTLTELFDESAVWHLPGRSRFADDYQGREATLAYFGQLGQETGGTFQAELQHVLADDEDRVVGIQRSRAQRDGKHLDVGNCIVFELKDGRITDGREHFHDLYAWDEFWS